jgi:hypothetical protein
MFPAPGRLLEGPAVWHGKDLSKNRSWLRTVSARESHRLRADLHKVRHKEFRDITRSDFGPGEIFDEIRNEILHGRGFVLLRGIDLEDLSIEDVARLYWGIGTHFGHALPQNAKGHVIGHVKDMGLRAEDPNVRLYQTTERQGFHTDSCDVVALLCLNKARHGGLSS